MRIGDPCARAGVAEPAAALRASPVAPARRPRRLSGAAMTASGQQVQDVRRMTFFSGGRRAALHAHDRVLARRALGPQSSDAPEWRRQRTTVNRFAARVTPV